MSAPDFDFEKWLEENQSCVSGFLVGEYSEDKVRELYALLRPRWVPVSERLPEHSGEYRVVKGDLECMWMDRLFFHHVAGKFEGVNDQWVTHWLPNQVVPELPKGEA